MGVDMDCKCLQSWQNCRRNGGNDVGWQAALQGNENSDNLYSLKFKAFRRTGKTKHTNIV